MGIVRFNLCGPQLQGVRVSVLRRLDGELCIVFSLGILFTRDMNGTDVNLCVCKGR